MESITVTDLRNNAREALNTAGARGFVRFAREGDALLLTDAASRQKDGGAALMAALETAGFVCKPVGTLLGITPGDALLARLCAREDGVSIDWGSTLHPVQAFADRLLRDELTQMTPAGRSFVIEAARLCWQPRREALKGLPELRARAAMLLRMGDRSGFAPAGRLLANWIDEQRSTQGG